jgi:hypothetical protein
MNLGAGGEGYEDNGLECTIPEPSKERVCLKCSGVKFTNVSEEGTAFIYS